MLYRGPREAYSLIYSLSRESNCDFGARANIRKVKDPIPYVLKSSFNSLLCSDARWLHHRSGILTLLPIYTRPVIVFVME